MGSKFFVSPGLLLCVMAVALTACSQSPNATSHPSSPTGTPIGSTSSSAVAANKDSINSGRYVALAPNESELAKMQLTYKTFDIPAAGSVINFVPLPPKSGNLVIGVKMAGAYHVKLTDLHCSFPINFKPSEGEDFTLTATAPEHDFSLTKAGQLTVAMSQTAGNNYYCNVSLTSR